MSAVSVVLADAIDAVLPQTQCRKCGYSACRPYAEALARGEADINRCAPGADETIARIAELLGVSPKPLDTRYGSAKPPSVALIDESRCIGCTLCIHACPVDAIVGAAKLMHTVIAAACTGCELCVEPCPVDCIAFIPAARSIDCDTAANEARARFEARNRRLATAREARKSGVRRHAEKKKDTIAKALERARQRLAGAPRR